MSGGRPVYDTAALGFRPAGALAAVWARRELIGTLAIRDIRARYQQSILGIYWTVLNPLLTAAVFTLVFSFIAQVPVGAVPYAVFVLCGLVPWNFFANSLSNATNSLVGMAGLLTKVAFPREILPISAVLARVMDLLVSFGILLIIMAWYHLPFHRTILLLPIIVLIEITFLLGLSFLLAAANLFYRDVAQLLTVVLSLWIFLTPVVYPITQVPASFRTWIELNPMTPVVGGFRSLIFDGVVPPIVPLATSGAVSLVMFLIGYAVFKRLEPLFAETV